jgi:hypothetical protein
MSEMTPRDAVAKLYQLAQAQTMIDSYRDGALGSVQRQGGTIVPSQTAIETVRRTHPELARLADSLESQ